MQPATRPQCPLPVEIGIHPLPPRLPQPNLVTVDVDQPLAFHPEDVGRGGFGLDLRHAPLKRLYRRDEKVRPASRV